MSMLTILRRIQYRGSKYLLLGGKREKLMEHIPRERRTDKEELGEMEEERLFRKFAVGTNEGLWEICKGDLFADRKESKFQTHSCLSGWN